MKNDKQEIFHWAYRNGHPEVVKALEEYTKGV
jgi:hypothetical protein